MSQSGSKGGLVQCVSLELPKPGLSDNRSHEARLRDALTSVTGSRPSMPLYALKKLGSVLPEAGYSIDSILVQGPCGDEVADVRPKFHHDPILGMAVDLGSTTVVFYLVDMVEKRLLHTLSKYNPQAAHGEDILERILFAGRGNGLSILQREVVQLFNDAAHELSSREGCTANSIYFWTVAGNTTMTHFFLGLDPSHICKEPYLPSASRFDILRPNEVGLVSNPGGRLYVFPNIGSYFGGDLIAAIIASGMHNSDAVSMLVDVGTNAEVILGNKDWMVACAGAAGPALEGGILSCGMRAQPGAIERVSIEPDTLEVHYKTIGGEPPKGLCGSAIIDLLAEMFTAGIVEQTGKLVKDRCPDRVVELNGELVFIVAKANETSHGQPVYISQSDIKNLIRSKGAMYTILNVVTQSVGISFEDIENFYVAGAFGNYIDPEKAITIGMLPDIPLERFKGLGNAAGKGALKLLLNKELLFEIEKLCERITYLEMNVRGDFMNQLTGALFLPHTDWSRFPTVRKKLQPKA